MIRGIDVSAYQVGVPWKDLIDNAGLAFAIIKGDQLTATDNHIALARAAGVPLVGEYFWDDPSIPAQAQIDCFAADIKEHDPDFIALDVEQYWGFWQDYWDYLAGKIKGDAIRKKTPEAISGHAFAVADGLQKLFPKKRVFIYSGTWFVLGYAQPMVYWLDDFALWWAHYYDLAQGARSLSWEQIKATPPEGFKVWMPNAFLTWDIWQYSSTIMVNGVKYDWNAYNGTLDDLKKLLGLTVTPPPPTLTLESLDARLRVIEALPWYRQMIPMVKTGN